MRYVSLWAVAVFLTGCPTRARIHGGDGGGEDRGGDAGGVVRDGDAGDPTIAIISPATMTFANGDVAIEVRVSGGIAAKVKLLRDDMAWQELSGPPFKFTWDTRPAADGDYTLTASATVGE
ncbi:MAG: Ig-like domain-containing protein, partial [Myxococcales bacterium]